MKASQMLIFFSIVLTLYGLINFYIIRRGLSVVPLQYKTIFIAAMVFIVISYIAGRFIDRVWISPVSSTLIWIGSFWLALMTYIFLSLVVVDLLRLVNHFLPFVPSFFLKDPEKAKRMTAIAVLTVSIIIVAGGFINTKVIVEGKYDIKIKKKAGDLKTLRIAVASDLHLGNIYSYGFMYELSEQINKMNPDIILLAGDIIDEDLGPVIKYDVGEHLKRLKAKYGVYAVTGNHEYFGGVDSAVKYLNAHNIKVLRDSSIKIDNSFYVVGREDRTNRNRKTLDEIIKGDDKSLPIIMMDHQPFHLEEAEQNGIDLQLSGHTHNGQMWPFDYIVEKVYELAWGYKVKGNTHYYVSCGVGGWGPPVRTGSRPEVVGITLKFIGNK
jgi:uncharacterized protein